MKVLLATDCYTFQTGGITAVVLALENGLREAGCQVKVLALSNSHRSYKEGESYYIRSFPFYDYPEHRAALALHDPLLDELTAWKPDIVHIHTEFSAALLAKAIAKKANCPVVMTTHTYFEYFIFGRFRHLPIVKQMAKTAGKTVYRQAEAVVVPSEKARSFPHLQPVADKVTVIPNGIYPERFQKAVRPDQRQALFRRWGLRDNGCTLVTVTRLSREKNIMEILAYFPDLLRKLPEAQLIIVGDGPDRKRLRHFCEKNHLTGHVRFTGRISPEEVYQYYDMGDVFVSASTFEVHSMSYLEAMASGLPLVCREDASLRGVLKNGENGYIYRNKREFIHAVSVILGSDAIRERMHQEALLQAERFSTRRFIERTLNLYHSVCEGPAH